MAEFLGRGQSEEGITTARDAGGRTEHSSIRRFVHDGPVADKRCLIVVSPRSQSPAATSSHVRTVARATHEQGGGYASDWWRTKSAKIVAGGTAVGLIAGGAALAGDGAESQVQER